MQVKKNPMETERKDCLDAGADARRDPGAGDRHDRDASAGQDAGASAVAGTVTAGNAPEARQGAVRPFKIPVSVLVIIHGPGGEVLLMQRADRPDYWQSVTGSLDAVDEDPLLAAARELQEETGFLPAAGRLWSLDIRNRYEIYAHWRHRYAPGVTHNTEHVFAFALPAVRGPRLAPREHLSFEWLPWPEAAARCFSPNNAEMIRVLARREGWPLPEVRPAGATAVRGATAATGAKGEQGGTGQTGVAGDAGVTGASGENGAAGKTSVTRAPGTGADVSAGRERPAQEMGARTEGVCGGSAPADGDNVRTDRQEHQS